MQRQRETRQVNPQVGSSQTGGGAGCWPGPGSAAGALSHQAVGPQPATLQGEGGRPDGLGPRPSHSPQTQCAQRVSPWHFWAQLAVLCGSLVTNNVAVPGRCSPGSKPLLCTQSALSSGPPPGEAQRTGGRTGIWEAPANFKPHAMAHLF